MNSRLAILCSGQGGQHPAMFNLARTDRHASMLLEQWALDSMFNMPLNTILAENALLFSNRIAQPLIVAATLVIWEAIKDRIPAPALVAGYSVGELASYGVAGALAAEDAISLAASRAKLMDGCLMQTPGQMLIAISGLDAASVGALARRHRFHIAIETGEDSVIAGGLSKSVAEIEKSVVQSGGRITVLPIEIASHTPYMQPAVAPFSAELKRHRLAAPAIPVLAGISAALITHADHAISTLSNQLAEKIRWMDCMDTLAEAGITVALELGPGLALSRMLQARHPAIDCRSVDDFRTLKGIATWLARRFD
jgi:[acyl-carrier-protein] S-malonyltransferase